MVNNSLKNLPQRELSILLDKVLAVFVSSEIIDYRTLKIELDEIDKYAVCLMLKSCGYINEFRQQFTENREKTVFPGLFTITPEGMMFYLTNSFVHEYNKKQKALKEESFRAKKIKWELCISILSLILSIIVFLDNAQIISFRFY